MTTASDETEPSLRGAVAIVTGASRGIGKGCAIELAMAGATVYVTGRTLHDGDSERSGSLDATIEEIANARRSCHRGAVRPRRRRRGRRALRSGACRARPAGRDGQQRVPGSAAHGSPGPVLGDTDQRLGRADRRRHAFRVHGDPSRGPDHDRRGARPHRQRELGRRDPVLPPPRLRRRQSCARPDHQGGGSATGDAWRHDRVDLAVPRADRDGAGHARHRSRDHRVDPVLRPRDRSRWRPIRASWSAPGARSPPATSPTATASPTSMVGSHPTNRGRPHRERVSAS